MFQIALSNRLTHRYVVPRKRRQERRSLPYALAGRLPNRWNTACLKNP